MANGAAYLIIRIGVAQRGAQGKHIAVTVSR